MVSHTLSQPPGKQGWPGMPSEFQTSQDCLVQKQNLARSSSGMFVCYVQGEAEADTGILPICPPL